MLAGALPQVLAPLGADTAGSQFLEPDGTFPNHIPNPENKEAMAAAVSMVKSSGATGKWACGVFWVRWGSWRG